MARPASQPDIGPELVELRAQRVPWKTISAKFGLGRCRLWRMWRAAVDAADAGWPTDDGHGAAPFEGRW